MNRRSCLLPFPTVLSYRPISLRYKRFGFILSLFLVFSFSSFGKPVYEERFEGSAEDISERWQFAQQRGKCCGSWDELEPPQGGGSLRLDIEEDETARATWLSQKRVPIKPNTPYKLSLALMHVGVSPPGRVYLIAYENGLEDPEHWHHTPFLTGTQDWHTVEVAFLTGPEAFDLKLQCKLWHSKGHAWFDDIVLTELEDTERHSLEQGAFMPQNDRFPLQLLWYPCQRRSDKTIHLLEKSLNPVALFFWGEKEKLYFPHLLLDLPPGVIPRGPMVHGRSTMPDPKSFSPEKIASPLEKSHRWRFPLRKSTLKKALEPEKPTWTEYHFIYLDVDDSCPKEFEWSWQIENAYKEGPIHTVPAQVHPRMKAPLRRVKRFPLYAQHTGVLRHPSKKARIDLLKTLQYAGIEGGLSLTHYQPEYANIDTELNRANFTTWAWNWNGYEGKGSEDQRLVYANGESSSSKLCPQVQAEPAEPFWSNIVFLYQNRLKSGLRTLIINYEPPRFNCCFCPRCRDAFAKRCGCAPEEMRQRSPQEIQAMGNGAWARFRAEQNAAIVKNHIAAIHMADPSVSVGLCAVPRTETMVAEGMDIALFEPEVSFHAPMIYQVGTQFESMVRSTCATCKAPVIPFILVSDLVVSRVFPTPHDLYLNLLAAALSGGEGATLWVGIEALDAEYLQALRASLQEIGRFHRNVMESVPYEALTISPPPSKTRRVTVGKQSFEVPMDNASPPVRSWSWKSKRGGCVGIINYDTHHTHSLQIERLPALKLSPVVGPLPTKLKKGPHQLRLGPKQASIFTW